MNIILTLECNNHCAYCFQQNIHKNEIMALDMLKRILLWSNLNGKNGIKLLGGEPTLYPYLNEAIELIDQYLPDSSFTIISNILENIEPIIQWRNIYFNKNKSIGLLINSTYDANKKEIFFNNLKNIITNSTPNEITYSITLLPNEKINKKYIDNVIEIMNFSDIYNLRIGLQSPIPENNLTNIYCYDNDLMYLINNIPYQTNIHFDCPINLCQVSKDMTIKLKTFNIDYRTECIGAPCDILPNGSVKYCFSSQDNYKIENVFDFENAITLNKYLRSIEPSHRIQNSKCKNCKYYLNGECYPCHSFDDVLYKTEQSQES